MQLHAAGVLTALAIAVFAAQCAVTAGQAALWLASFGATAWLLASGGFDATTAFVIAAAVAAALARPHWRLLPPLAAGFSAAAWASILEAQGLPRPPAALAAWLLTAVAVVLAVRRGFSSASLRDEALLLTGIFAALLAIGPDIVEGWRSAVVLAAEPLAAQPSAAGPWLAALVAACVLLGGAYSWWKRR